MWLGDIRHLLRLANGLTGNQWSPNYKVALRA